jgi:hypothetical protein
MAEEKQKEEYSAHHITCLHEFNQHHWLFLVRASDSATFLALLEAALEPLFLVNNDWKKLANTSFCDGGELALVGLVALLAELDINLL